MLPTVLILSIYLVGVNLLAYRAFAADKQFAINKTQRTPEATLLLYAKSGGWIGAKTAQQRLRHKSYKQPFADNLNSIGKMQAACLTTVACVFAALILAPTGDGAPVSPAAVANIQPAGAPVLVSLRPPEARP